MEALESFLDIDQAWRAHTHRPPCAHARGTRVSAPSPQDSCICSVSRLVHAGLYQETGKGGCSCPPAAAGSLKSV